MQIKHYIDIPFTYFVYTPIKSTLETDYQSLSPSICNTSSVCSSSTDNVSKVNPINMEKSDDNIVPQWPSMNWHG